MSDPDTKPTTAMVEHVARALCLRSETKGAWPNEEHMKHVELGWRKHEEGARVAIHAIGQFLSRNAV